VVWSLLHSSFDHDVHKDWQWIQMVTSPTSPMTHGIFLPLEEILPEARDYQPDLTICPSGCSHGQVGLRNGQYHRMHGCSDWQHTMTKYQDGISHGTTSGIHLDSRSDAIN
jgi:hypothetical protein